jgi:hypothetical protein
MKKLLLSFTLIAVAAASPAHATIIDATFNGTVASQSGTTATVGQAITGEFIYDTLLSAYTKFTVGSASISAGYASRATLTPDRFSALFQAQISPVSQGGTVNRTFTVDLEGLSPWTAANAVAVLTSAQFATNLDTAGNPASTFPSTFGYNLSNSDGSGTQRVTANLAAIRVATTNVPEPASLGLVAAALLGLRFGRRRT